jgi:hypothetical protein
VRAMTYLAPGGDKIIDPAVEVLERIIFGERNSYWRCGSGDSSLGVVEHLGKQHMAMVKDEPVLMFFLVERHGFFFTHFQPTESMPPNQFVPFAGGDCRPWVRHNIGGDDFYAPRACFVSRPFAWVVVQEFLRSKGRSRAVPWVDRFSLAFPNPAAGDKPPSKKELA